MKLKHLLDIFFIGDYLADSDSRLWEEEEDDTPDNNDAESPRDGYLRYEIEGIPVRAELKSNGTTIIGSSRFADYQISGRNINESHAAFWREKNQYYVKNISTNGKVRVGNYELAKDDKYALSLGAIIQLEDISMKFMRRPPPAPGTIYSF